jgi:hypothetical protein
LHEHSSPPDRPAPIRGASGRRPLEPPDRRGRMRGPAPIPIEDRPACALRPSGTCAARWTRRMRRVSWFVHARTRPRMTRYRLCTCDAPEWTRTTTRVAPDKALNRIRVALMGPGASRSSSLRGFVDVSDGSGEVDVLKMFSRAGAAGCRGRWAPAEVRRSDF